MQSKNNDQLAIKFKEVKKKQCLQVSDADSWDGLGEKNAGCLHQLEVKSSHVF
jgi:hypothetical protein